MARLIDADKRISEIKKLYCDGCDDYGGVRCRACSVYDSMCLIDDATTVNATELPCKIGDMVWAIRSFHGIKHPQKGVVSEIYFMNNMEIQVVVKYVARGKWGETVFATKEEAEAAIAERRTDG